MIFGSITGGLSGNGLGGTIAKAAAPFVAEQIGEYFKTHTVKYENGFYRETPEHIIAHGILGAAVAAANGDNAFAGGLSAAGAEALAPILVKWLYPNTKPENLTAEQQSTITSILALGGMAVGGIVGGDNNVIAGGDGARNAVDNNAWIVTKDHNGNTIYKFVDGKCAKVAKKGDVCLESDEGRIETVKGSFLEYGDIKYPTSAGGYTCTPEKGCVVDKPAPAATPNRACSICSATVGAVITLEEFFATFGATGAGGAATGTAAGSGVLVGAGVAGGATATVAGIIASAPGGAAADKQEAEMIADLAGLKVDPDNPVNRGQQLFNGWLMSIIGVKGNENTPATTTSEQSTPATPPDPDDDKAPVPDAKKMTRLSKGEIKAMKKAGFNPHDYKPKKNGSNYDLFKDKNGNVYVNKKNGNGTPDPTNLNVKDLKK